MDKIGADFMMSVNSIYEKLTDKAIPIQMPHGGGSDFQGIIDLVEMKYYYYEGTHGEIQNVKEIPAELLEEAEAMREAMIEKVSGFDDDIAMKFLDGEVLSVEEIKQAIRA
jgi:elongation factor G